MSTRDLEERHLARFRLGTDRRVELTLQKELDNVARASIAEMATKKEAKKKEPLTIAQQNTKYYCSIKGAVIYYQGGGRLRNLRAHLQNPQSHTSRVGIA